MIEIENVTVYKCEHCDFTGTYKNVVQKHEEKCLINQDKTNKNIDKAEIYNILDIDLLNIKIKEFVEKYNLPVSSGIEFVKISIDNSNLPNIELDKSIRGIFDWTKFRLHNILSEQRYSKEYLSCEHNDELEEMDTEIEETMGYLNGLYKIKKIIILELIKNYLKGIKC